MVVIDEAYGEFRRTGTPSALELLASTPNLVVSRTMSKAFALAGARLGYLAASTEICDALRVVRLPYHLSAVTQAVGRRRAEARRRAAGPGRRPARRAGRDRVLAAASRASRSPTATRTSCLFGRFEDRHAVWQGLLDRGVLIRETGPDGWLRVSVGTPEEMAAFKAALLEVLGR